MESPKWSLRASKDHHVMAISSSRISLLSETIQTESDSQASEFEISIPCLVDYLPICAGK